MIYVILRHAFSSKSIKKLLMHKISGRERLFLSQCMVTFDFGSIKVLKVFYLSHIQLYSEIQSQHLIHPMY